MKCLETRRTKEGLKFRRFRKENGRLIKTIEIPYSIYSRFKFVIDSSMPGFLRAEESRDRIFVIKKMLADGEKCEYIAAVVGVTPSRVRQIKSRGK